MTSYKTLHKDNFLSKGEGRERRERNGSLLKEDVSGLFLWRPSKFSVKGETWRVVVTLLGETFLDKLEDLSDRVS